MKLKQQIAALVALALMLMGGSAFAVTVNLGAQPAIVSAINIADGSAADLTLQSFQLLGTNENGDYLIYAYQNCFSVASAYMNGIVASLPADLVSSLPNTADMTSLAYGSRGEAVQRLQAALKTLGYLDGSVDGDFGRGTERAVVAYQAAVGAKQDGIVNPLLQMLAISMADSVPAGGQADGATGQIEVQPVANEMLYAAIANRVSVNMQPIYNANLTFNYDDMTGKGLISDGTILSYDLSEGTDISKYQLTVQFGLLVRDNEDGTVSVDPAIVVSCACVHRPIMTEVIIKSDTARSAAPIQDLSSTLSGVTSVESGYAILDDQMVAALANSVETGELKIRINGRYHAFDVQLDSPAIAAVSKIGVLAQQIKF